MLKQFRGHFEDILNTLVDILGRKTSSVNQCQRQGRVFLPLEIGGLTPSRQFSAEAARSRWLGRRGEEVGVRVEARRGSSAAKPPGQGAAGP